jgi:uncharacterized protein (DUF1501 family)
MPDMRVDRRKFLVLAGSTLALPLLGGGVAVAGPQAPRLVIVNLRGGLDGLGAIAPYGDPLYRQTRGTLALPEPGAPSGLHDLDGFFGLHPSLAHGRACYNRGELLPAIGVASPYRNRSHFDAQDVLANGTSAPAGRTGWLNRALPSMGGDEASAISVGALVPLLLRGPAPVSSWVPAADEEPQPHFLATIDGLYEADPDLGPLWQESRRASMNADQASGSRGFEGTCATAAALLDAPVGPRVVSLELSGWDTHSAQGSVSGRLANRLALLDKGLARLHADMSPETWSRTVILVVSEFGRTVRINGTGGTDHGTAGACLLLGGAVNGGTVLHDWRGLQENALYDGRDLYPSTDIRSIFKAVLRDHMKIGEGVIESDIFPGSAAAPARPGLIRS